MAHKLSFKDGKAEMAYAGQTPWHNLGTKVEGLQTAQDMLGHAGLLWTVSTTPLQTEAGKPISGFVGIRRDDKDIVLGVASDRYTPIQNTQAADVMDALATEGQAHVEVCGALDEGHRCWMLAQLPETFEVVKGDAVRPYVLLAWGHDGKHGLAAKLTPIRVVCNNTLTMALGDKWSKSAEVYVKHTKNANIRLEEAQRALGLVRKQVEKTAEAYKLLAATDLTTGQARGYFGDVFPEPVLVDEKSHQEKLARWNDHQEKLLKLYESGVGSELAGGTAWGAYNAVTEFVDHVYPVLKSGEVSQTRQESVLFGSYNELKGKALTQALALADQK